MGQVFPPIQPPHLIELKGIRPGKTILVTGGMDGDEYAGIEAAKELCNRYQDRQFAGTILIVPLVNEAGSAAGISEHPGDHKLPKLIFPGNITGSPSEQLVAWLKKHAIDRAHAWIDLHSGAHDEFLKPYLHCYRTGNKVIDTEMEALQTHLSSELIVYERAPFFSKPRRLAKQQCLYLLAESGEHGERKTADIAQHLRWVEDCLSFFKMIPERPTREKSITRITQHVAYLFAPMNGRWLPKIEEAHSHLIGHIQPIKKKDFFSITIPNSGRVLWMKEGFEAKKGDFLAAYTY
jgi:predicted deacylase